MNIFLWVLQILLALHTVIGAVWKFSNSEQMVPSLGAIPHGVWMALIVFELLCALGLVLPLFSKQLAVWAVWAPIAAIGIAAEMLLFSGVHLFSGGGDNSQLIYWLVVAVVCAFVAYGRLVLKPV
jgi:hypothetical protein